MHEVYIPYPLTISNIICLQKHVSKSSTITVIETMCPCAHQTRVYEV